MKIVFPLEELAESIEDAAGLLFEQSGGVLGDGGLKLAGLNTATQEFLFALTPDAVTEGVVIDLSPVPSSDAPGTDDGDGFGG